MKSSIENPSERLLNWVLKVLLRRRILDNQRYVIDTWNRFVEFNEDRDDNDKLSFQSYAIFGGSKRLFRVRRMRIVAEATYRALLDHVEPKLRDRVTIGYYNPSEDSPHYAAYIYMWTYTAPAHL